MSRKKFIESQGATCRNWRWSWSFRNDEKKIVIFGEWATKGGLILDERWERNSAGKNKPAYPEALNNIRLVNSGVYTLKTFPMIYSDELEDENGRGPAKIKGFVPKLTQKTLNPPVGGQWYAIADR